MAIICCAADAQVVGLVCKYSDRDALKSRSWYEITGILRSEKSDKGELTPYLDVTDYKYLEKHDDDYIYMQQ